jgi:hypothetical protein
MEESWVIGDVPMKVILGPDSFISPVNSPLAPSALYHDVLPLYRSKPAELSENGLKHLKL